MADDKGYGKINEADQERQISRQKARKRITIIILFVTIILTCAVVGIAVGVSQSKDGKSSDEVQSISSAIKSVCVVTLYPDSCYNSIFPLVTSGKIQFADIFKLSMEVAMKEISKASDKFFENEAFKNLTDKMAIEALDSCHELLSLSLYHLNNSLASADNFSVLEAFDDLQTWLSAAGTYQQTCIEGFDNATSFLSLIPFENFKNSTEYTSNSLAIISSIANSIDSLDSIGRRRRLMTVPDDHDHDGPKWLSSKDRMLLQESNGSNLKVDAVVAADGSGKYKDISAALKDVPPQSEKRYVIYVKKGIYVENVKVEISKWNVIMIGDGMNDTIVSGKLNFADGTPTFETATVAVFGKGFIARDMGFINTAGAIKQQAVALMSTADQSVFYRCQIQAFQDTLYSHSNRQFYRECDIYGTVDFIFGNSAVVFQNCNIFPQKPTKGQQNTITAQGKFDPNQNTGICIQNCTIMPAPTADLTGIQTFLGRPWKNYSTTIFIQNMMGRIIDAKGWLPWMGTTPPDTIFYAEYQNFGPGAMNKTRVNWKGLKHNIASKQATKFTVKSFVNGDKWLPATGVIFKPGLQ